MGHREDLLKGAKQCLFEKGYARTTARDIVAASQTNLASIGYHFGSKEALLNAALLEATREMSTDLIALSGPRMATGRASDTAEAWSRVIDAFDRFRPILVAQAEAWAQVERSPELREALARQYTADRDLGTSTSQQVFPSLDAESARAVASVTMALADGLVIQWLLDPENAPNGRQVALGLHAMARLTGVNDES